MNLKNILKTLAGATLISSLFACSNITNLTPENVSANPSGIYTLSMSAELEDASVLNRVVVPYAVVDGGMLPMKEVSSQNGYKIYECDYKMPNGKESVSYYYVVKFMRSKAEGAEVQKQIISDMVYTLKPVSQYISSLSFERAPVGTTVAILGRGFNSQDKVKFGGVYADIQSVSRNAINFIVPPLPAGKNYDVEVETSAGKNWVGQFKIDAAEISVSPSRLEMQSGDVVNLVLTIGFKAPEGGYPIDVKTNIPSSVIMPEVVVKEGEDRVIVPVRAASTGTGSLFINATGFAETVVPVSVSQGAGFDGEVSVKDTLKKADK